CYNPLTISSSILPPSTTTSLPPRLGRRPSKFFRHSICHRQRDPNGISRISNPISAIKHLTKTNLIPVSQPPTRTFRPRLILFICTVKHHGRCNSLKIKVLQRPSESALIGLGPFFVRKLNYAWD